MDGDQEIQGLPTGATVRPLGGAPHEEIEGLPEGAEVRALNQETVKQPEQKQEGAVSHFARKALSSAGLPESISDVPRWGRHMLGIEPDSKPFWQPAVEAVKHPTEENIVGAVPFIGPSSVQAARDIHNKDYVGAAGSLAGAVFPAVGPHIQDLAVTAPERISSALESRRLTQGPSNIETALATPAGKGGLRAAKMKEDIHAATADLAEIEKEAPAKVTMLLKRGKGAENFRELADKIDERQEKMWDEGHKPGIERHAQAPIDENRIVAAGQRALTEMAQRANPQEAASAKAWLSEQQKPTTLKQADELIRYINDDLKAKGAETRYGPLSVSTRQAVVKALRDEVDRVLTDSGEHGVRAVNRRWGALENIKSRLQERAIQEAQREAKNGPVPDWVHLYTFMHPEGLALGASIQAARALRPNASTTLTTGLRQLGRTSLEAPFEATPPVGWGRPPAGLLPPPATPLGGPGTAELAHPEMFPRTNPAVPAPRSVQRGAGGRMQRVYSGEMPPAVIGRTAEGGPIREERPLAPQRAERPTEQRSAMRERAAAERRKLPVEELKASRDTKILQKVMNDPLETAQRKAIARQQLKDLKNRNKKE